MAAIEIEVENDDDCCDCACCKNCPDCGSAPTKTKDQLLADLKALLMKNDSNGQAQRQLDIDKLISQIEDLSDD